MKWSKVSLLNSRPIPEHLKPPNGRPTSPASALIPTLPVRSARATRVARSSSALKTAPGQAVGGVVGQAYRVGLVLVRDQAQHGAEDLLLRDAHRVVDVGEDGRLDEPAFGAFGEAPRRRGAPSRPGGAARTRCKSRTRRELTFGDERADHRCGIERIADRQRGDGGVDRRGELVVARARNERRVRAAQACRCRPCSRAR